MRIGLKKISILALTAVFFTSVILCCCLTKTTQADEPNVPACHKTTDTKKTSHNANDYGCCKSKFQADHAIVVSLNITPAALELVSLEPVSDSHPILKNKLDLAYLDGPPGLTSNTPLYISFHNFRI